MNIRSAIPLLLASALSAPAAIVHSGPRDIAIPFDFDGVYLNIDTGASGSGEPADWTTSPTINLFFGGVGIATDDYFRPVTDGGAQVVNLTVGASVGPGSVFAGSPNGSDSHMGTDPDQFQPSQSGYLGFAFRVTGSEAEPYYGWLRFTPSNTGPGVIHEWAFEDNAGQPIQVALVPEPATAALLAGSCVLAVRRRRR